MLGRRRDRARPARDWTHQKMLVLLVGAALMVALLLFGLGLSVVYALRPGHHTGNGIHAKAGTAAAATAGRAEGADPSIAAQDALAQRPMPVVDIEASHPGPVSTADPGPAITVPAATRTGPAGVPTGYPHTPEGAMAQLAAIDQVALQSGSLTIARDVISNWAMPGGPTTTSWSGVQALATLFTQMGLSGGGTPQLAIVLTPVMGQIKGSVGPNLVVPCIDFELDLTLTQTSRGATADCQRMVWEGGRWLIGAGSEPATPPSVWPDTDLAINVGYRDLRQEPAHD